jgi:hypothetical protein
MHVSDLDIQYSAHLYVQIYGNSAMGRALHMVERMRGEGDAEGTSTWLRMIAAIISLGEQPIEAWHDDGCSRSWRSR